MTISRIRVYLLDDYAVVRQGVRLLLEAAGDIEVVGESGSAVSARHDLQVLRPDVAILDARLPDGSGIAVCREARSSDPSIRALILTSYDDDQALFAAILAGASGYVLKEINGTRLLDGVRLIAEGVQLIGPDLMARVLERARRPSTDVPGSADLTAQEVALLTLITHGLTDRLIAEEMTLDRQTLRRLVESIMAKVGLEEEDRATARAYNRLPGVADLRAQGPGLIAHEIEGFGVRPGGRHDLDRTGTLAQQHPTRPAQVAVRQDLAGSSQEDQVGALAGSLQDANRLPVDDA